MSDPYFGPLTDVQFRFERLEQLRPDDLGSTSKEGFEDFRRRFSNIAAARIASVAWNLYPNTPERWKKVLEGEPCKFCNTFCVGVHFYQGKDRGLVSFVPSCDCFFDVEKRESQDYEGSVRERFDNNILKENITVVSLEIVKQEFESTAKFISEKFTDEELAKMASGGKVRGLNEEIDRDLLFQAIKKSADFFYQVVTEHRVPNLISDPGFQELISSRELIFMVLTRQSAEDYIKSLIDQGTKVSYVKMVDAMNFKNIDPIDGVERLQNKLRQANYLVLDKPTTSFLIEFTQKKYDEPFTDSKEMNLPFPLTWIETAGGAMFSSGTYEGENHNFSGEAYVIGALCEEVGADTNMISISFIDRGQRLGQGGAQNEIMFIEVSSQAITRTDDRVQNMAVLVYERVKFFFDGLREKKVRSGFLDLNQKYKVKTREGKEFHKVKRIVLVGTKKSQKDLPPRICGREVNWKHTWEVMGHWMRVKGLGKNRQGEYVIPGKSWRIPHTKGEGPLIKKTRYFHTDDPTDSQDS